MPLSDKQKEKRKRIITEAAKRLFLERGFNDTSVAEIARLVGMTKPTIYSYFGGKSSLLLEVLRKEANLIVERALDEVSKRKTPEERLQTLFYEIEQRFKRNEFLRDMMSRDPDTITEDTIKVIVTVQEKVRESALTEIRKMGFGEPFSENLGSLADGITWMLMSLILFRPITGYKASEEIFPFINDMVDAVLGKSRERDLGAEQNFKSTPESEGAIEEEVAVQELLSGEMQEALPQSAAEEESSF